MHVSYHCPSCQQTNHATVATNATELACTACNWTRPIPSDPAEKEHPSACLVCGCADLWRRKNFPPQLGVAIVVIAAVLSIVFHARYQPLWAIGVLMAAAAIDMLLFALMPDVLVCYRCGARYLRFNPAGGTPHFNLETAERHRQADLRRKKT